MKKATWYSAFIWDCPSCNKENIERGADGFDIVDDNTTLKCPKCKKWTKLNEDEG